MSAASTIRVPASGLYADPRREWLALRAEEILDPDLPIVDAHHHLWDRGGAQTYLLPDILDDVGSGHRITATVYVDCRSMYRATGPQALRPVGEVEFANGVAAMSASGGYGSTRICAAIVGHADLRLGDAVRPVLEALIAAGGGRFRGIRQVSAWDANPDVLRPLPTRPPGLLGDPSFRRGFACLAPLGLSFDAFLLHPQIPELTDLARAFPETRIVLDHVGGPIGLGHYAGHAEENFRDWRTSMAALAGCANVWVKLGGLGMCLPGFDFHLRPQPPGSEALAAAWGPYIVTTIELFGAQRCLFESNFPPDKGSCSYAVLWNAFKRIAAAASDEERQALFAGSAMACYRL